MKNTFDLKPCHLIRLLLSISFMISLGFAQDKLYAPAPPANSAFVRIIHASETRASSAFSFAGVSYDELAFTQVSPYRVIPQGQYSLEGQNLTIEATKFYTIAIQDENLLLLEDSINTNRAKALLRLSNLSNYSQVDLKTADTDVNINVISELGINQQESIEVNSVTIDFAVFADSKMLGLLEQVKLERGSAYSVIVLDNAVLWVQSVTLTD